MFLILMAAVLAVCDVAQSATVAKVFVVGQQMTYNGYVATIWEDGKIYTLSDGSSSDNCSACAYDVYLSGNDIYVAGYTRNAADKNVAVIWKNGFMQRLSDGSLNASAASVYVSGSDIYVAGGENGKPVMWKNGVMQILPADRKAYVSSVYVSGSDVYAAGTEQNAIGDDIAVLWKNGNQQRLSNENYHASAQSVYVSGSDVYVAGYEENARGKKMATLWKNGVAQRLSDQTRNAYAVSVFVSGGDVYVAGSSDTDALLWKNGMEYRLPRHDSYRKAAAKAVYVSNGDIYVSGIFNVYEKEGSYSLNGTAPALWKNTVIQHLERLDGYSDICKTWSVFVTENP
jgi:sulfur transfer complex TusBCD TusB component (DsrH family)